MKYNFAEYEKKLKKYLDKDRYRHTLGVMYTAAALAMAHDYDMEQAQMAGLLHDCAKCIPNKKKLKICKKQDIRVSSVEKSNPFLLHAKLGAYIAKEKIPDRGRRDPLCHPLAYNGKRSHERTGEDRLHCRLYRTWQEQSPKTGMDPESGF